MNVNKFYSKMPFLLLILLIGTNMTLPAYATGEISFLSNSGYIDMHGYYHVVGELQNIGNQTINFVQVTVTFYDKNNVIIDTRLDITPLYVILPGQITPFNIVFLDTEKSKIIDHYGFKATFLQAKEIPQKLEIIKHTFYKDEKGRMHIIGELKNHGNEKLINIKIIATYYDSLHKVVAVALTYHEPNIKGEIYPNQTVPFEILLDEQRSKLVQKYTLIAESNQYAMIPLDLPSLTLEIIGNGTVTKMPNQEKYPKGTQIELSAVASTGWFFSRWEGNISSTLNPMRIKINNSMTIMAIFNQSYTNQDKSILTFGIILVIVLLGILFMLFKILYKFK